MDYRAMSRLAQDPAAVRSTAAKLKIVLAGRLTARQQRFLTELENFVGPDPLPMEDREQLDALQKKTAPRRQEVGGYRAFAVLKTLETQIFSLDEYELDFIKNVLKYGPTVSLSDRQWGYVFVLLKKVGLLEEDAYVPIA